MVQKCDGTIPVIYFTWQIECNEEVEANWVCPCVEVYFQRAVAGRVVQSCMMCNGGVNRWAK